LKEVAFINKNKDAWKQVESLLDKKYSSDKDEITSLYVKLTDDLAFAKTFYPNAKVTQYLNNLSARTHQYIYKNKKEFSGRFISFWKTELPGIIGKEMKSLLVSFIVFSMSFGIGWISAGGDSTFVRLILGDAYIYETLQNIESGKAMNIYGSIREDAMFLYITANNIFVSFLCFMMGIFTPLGVFYILLRNGIMLGAFLHFFYEKNLLGEAMSAIWMHGTIEISAIVIAGGAGIIMGKSFLFPGTYERSQSFMMGVRNGIKIIFGLVPFFIIAGFIESFLTRHYDVSLFFSLSVILISIIIIVGYFIVYPIFLRRRNSHTLSSLQKNEDNYSLKQNAYNSTFTT
jgi:uncharacterized membrane protein SpoIIM required for sporulation